MALSDVEPVRRPPGMDCVFSRLDDVLDDADRVKLAGWLGAYTDHAIAVRLTEDTGIPVNPQQVSRHRLGRCVRCQTLGRVWT